MRGFRWNVGSWKEGISAENVDGGRPMLWFFFREEKIQIEGDFFSLIRNERCLHFKRRRDLTRETNPSIISNFIPKGEFHLKIQCFLSDL